ncbi:MAG: CRTAC1 family protein [Pseudomonadota bacterium]
MTATDRRSADGEARIKRAFRRSLLVIFGLASMVAVGTALFLWSQREAPSVVDEADVGLDRLLTETVLPETPRAPYTDIAAAAGIDFVHRSGATGDRLLPETMGGGVAFFDADEDGDADLLFVDSGPWADDTQSRSAFNTLRLYLNDGSGRFEDATLSVGLAGDFGFGMGVAVADYDGDGRTDLFLSAVGSNRLFANRPQGFVDVTETAGVAGAADAWSTSAAFFDADGDADLDLFVLNYVAWSREIDFEVDYRLTGIGRAYGPPGNFAGTQPYFYRNLGDGRFEEASVEAGFHVVNAATQQAVGKGLALVPIDLDGDDDLDLVVANDTVRNFAFINLGDGQFEERGTELGLGFDRNGRATGAMGIDAANLFGDRVLAIGMGNFSSEMSSFYVASGDGAFSDEAIGRGIGAASRAALTFGLMFFDYDLDGRLDLLQANGHVENEINRVQSSQTYRQSAQLFWNCGPDCRQTFIPVASQSTAELSQPIVGRGAAYADVDADGALELVLTQIDGPPLLLDRSEAAPGHWLRVALQGAAPNTDAIGAVVTLVTGAQRQTRTVMPTRSYLSQVEPVLTFGLGASRTVDRIDVRWPDGTTTRVGTTVADQLVRISQQPER